MRRNEKKPLFRKVNTTARGVHHGLGGDYRHARNTKAEKNSEATHQSMHGSKHRGLDYTPLFKFLLSKLGKNWNEIYSEAISRLDRPDPIFWLVALHDYERQEYVRIGEASFFSGLFVDEKGLLQLVNPFLSPDQIPLQCDCCTHSLNGIPLPKRFHEAHRSVV